MGRMKNAWDAFVGKKAAPTREVFKISAIQNGLILLEKATPYPIDPAFADLTTGGFRTQAAAPEAGEYFGPQKPLVPLGPEEAAGRRFDYPFAVNIQIQPRATEAVGFDLLRNLADNHDVTRLCIETRKDQIAKLKSDIRPRKDMVAAGKQEDRINEIRFFLRFPDRATSWQQWLRMLLEDLLVIDAPCIFPRESLDGKLYALELVDGATITPKLDAHGRTPISPDPAYQQIIKGMPATNYTAEQLIYRPRNPRTHKIYGYSPVEQVIVTINIALRRILHQLSFYTDGSIPEGFAELPADWGPDQIIEFGAKFNAMLQGNVQERRKMQFLPAGSNAIFPKLAAIKDEYDEWLARLVCYCFSLPPTPFVRQMNRAVAATAQEAALQEGLAPLMLWIKDMMDYIIWRYWGYTDLEFAWEEEESVDSATQAIIDNTYVNDGIMKRSEIRARLGQDDDGIPDFLIAGQSFILLDDIKAAAKESAAGNGGGNGGPPGKGNGNGGMPDNEEGNPNAPVETPAEKLAKAVTCAYREGLL